MAIVALSTASDTDDRNSAGSSPGARGTAFGLQPPQVAYAMVLDPRRIPWLPESSINRPAVAPATASDASNAQLSQMLRWETLRSIAAQPASTASFGSGILLLVAIQHFDAPPTAKALIAAAFPLGLLLSLIAVHVTARSTLKVSQALAAASLLAALGIGVSGLSSSFTVFFWGVMLGVPFVSMSAPLVTTIWRQSVPDAQRGRYFARITSLATFFAVVGSALVAWWLRDDISRYQPALYALSLLLGVSAYASLKLPSRPISRPGRNPISALALLWQDPRFGLLNAAWFLMGIANLATMPLRTEYVAAADGLAYDPQTVLYLTLIIPSGVSLVATLIWGPLFDRFGFLKLRSAINVFFMLSLLAFFMPSLSLQILGSVLLGVAFGGGRVIWQLWVIQVAPPEQTADYMSVHTFLTGVRGIFGPIGAYALLGYLPMLYITNGAVVVMLISTLMFVWIGRRS